MKQTIKKFLVLSLVISVIVACAMLFSACDNSDEDYDGVLTVYNCEDYIDESIFEDFTEWYYEKSGKRYEINYVTYDANETMLTKVLNNDAGVDVICTSEYAIQKLKNSDMLLPINKTEGMNTVNQGIYDRTVANFGEDFADYFVPYMYGTLGILYNADVFEENDIDIEEYGWGILWNNAECEAIEGKILMKDSIRDTFAAGVLYLKEQDMLPEGYSEYTPEQLINCTDNELVQAVKEALISQKHALKGYEVDFGKDDLISLHAYVDLAWSGDAMYAIEEAERYNVNLDYYVPEVGANIWFDGWFIPKSGTEPEAATAFIEFMCIPSISARNMIEVGYTSAVDIDQLKADEEVVALLEENEYDFDEFFTWEVRYPDINNPDLGMMSDYGEKGREMTVMWEEVKAATAEDTWEVWLLATVILAGIIVLLALAYVVMILIKHFRDDRRYL